MSLYRVISKASVALLIAVTALIAASAPASASVCTLADHIRSANTNTAVGFCPAGTSHDIITIAEDITLTEPLPPITGTITIEGGGHTISGDGKYRIFDVQGGTLTIRNLTLSEGSAPDANGGAVRLRNGANVVIEHSSFLQNSAVRGGAIALTTGNTRLSVRHASFRSNSARSGGGAVFTKGESVYIIGSSFEHNRVVLDGGAIAALSGHVDVSNSSFFRNQAAQGGAVFVNGGETTLTHVTMIVNDGHHRGDSLYRGAGRLFLRNSIVFNVPSIGGYGLNCAGGLDQSVGNLSQDGTCGKTLVGRAMQDRMTGSPAYFPLKDGSPAIDAADPNYCLATDQIGTTRPQGGGCDIGAFESTAATPAPAIPPHCALPDQLVAANTDAPFGSCPAGNGADNVILLRDLTLRESLPTITSNVTIQGNGFTISGDNKFRIFHVDGGELALRDLTLTDGFSIDRGGAILVENGGKAIIENLTFRGNHADGAGGAIRLETSASAIVEDSSFISNSADWGGAIATESARAELIVKKSSFRHNASTPGGGAILVNGGDVDISASGFVYNESSLYGGAIEIIQGKVSVANSSFHGNNARYGGAIVVGGGETTLTHLTLLDNRSLEGGDSLRRSGGHLYLRNSIVADDYASAACVGDLAQNIGNLIEDGSCSPAISGDPLLDDLSGAPGYHALLDGSPAIGAADPRYCLETDQLGTSRPQGGGCDIGAIESTVGSPARVESAARETVAACAVTTTHALNFRDRPSLAGARIGLVRQGATLDAVGRTARWFNVEYQGVAGWISADYVVTEGDCR